MMLKHNLVQDIILMLLLYLFFNCQSLFNFILVAGLSLKIIGHLFLSLFICLIDLAFNIVNLEFDRVVVQASDVLGTSCLIVFVHARHDFAVGLLFHFKRAFSSVTVTEELL